MAKIKKFDEYCEEINEKKKSEVVKVSPGHKSPSTDKIPELLGQFKTNTKIKKMFKLIK